MGQYSTAQMIPMIYLLLGIDIIPGLIVCVYALRTHFVDSPAAYFSEESESGAVESGQVDSRVA